MGEYSLKSAHDYMRRAVVPIAVAAVVGIGSLTGVVQDAAAQDTKPLVDPATMQCYEQKPMGAQELIELYTKDPLHQFVCLNLEGIDLSGKNLPKIQITFSNLQRADLEGAILNGASFRKSDLTGANLSNAELTNAYFFESDLAYVKFHGAYLQNAEFTLADLDGADFTGAKKVQNADFEVAINVDNAKGLERASKPSE